MNEHLSELAVTRAFIRNCLQNAKLQVATQLLTDALINEDMQSIASHCKHKASLAFDLQLHFLKSLCYEMD